MAQWVELHGKIIKGLSSQQEKMMVGPNPLNRFKPKTHEGIDLGAHETKGRKEEAQPAKIRKSKGSPMIRTGPGYPEAARNSESSGHVTKLGWD